MMSTDELVRKQKDAEDPIFMGFSGLNSQEQQKSLNEKIIGLQKKVDDIDRLNIAQTIERLSSILSSKIDKDDLENLERMIDQLFSLIMMMVQETYSNYLT